ncbi:MAG: exosortase C-terminal domain/associated protein EpsI [Planctomycetota bacterium]|jgi:EpsI family protein
MAKILISFDFRYFIVIVLLSVTIFFSQLRSDGELVPITKSLEDFPKQIAGWRGEPYRFSQAVYDKLGVDNSISINYKNNNGDEISMYIGYYESQKQGEIIHSPKNCMLGSGWQPIDISEINISIGSRMIPVVKMIVEKRSQKMVVLYWFQSGNRAVANEYSQRLYFIHDSLRYNRTNSAFIRFTSPVSNNDYEGTEQLMEKFINKVVPILDDFLPSNEVSS